MNKILWQPGTGDYDIFTTWSMRCSMQTRTINNKNMYVVDMHAYWVEQKKPVKTFDWCVYVRDRLKFLVKVLYWFI